MLSNKLISEVLATCMSSGGDFAEIFIEDVKSSGLGMLKNKVEKSSYGRDFGIGIRIMKGTNQVYTYTSAYDRDSLLRAAKKASLALSNVDTKFGELDLQVKSYIDAHKVKKSPLDTTHSERIELMRNASKAAYAHDLRITEVMLGISDYVQKVTIANTEGLLVEDTRTRTRLMVSAIAEKDGKRESGMAKKGSGHGFELYDMIDVAGLGKRAAEIAITNLSAKEAPSGPMPVILANRFGGVIFHEACGHGLESDQVARGNSVYTGKLGQKVASELVNAVDDGTIPNEWGSMNIDDEGTPTRRNLLIENGVLKSYMIDRMGGRRMNSSTTGSGRRQSYKYAPSSRMTNTYILGGKDKFEDMIASTEYGIYASELGGGQVNPITGEFNFALSEGFMVRDGKIAEPIKNASLIGTGLEVLQKIEMIGSNFEGSEGMCGSISGSIPAGVGQPTLKVSSLTVGGRG